MVDDDYIGEVGVLPAEGEPPNAGRRATVDAARLTCLL
jgi:hypothetical protein